MKYNHQSTELQLYLDRLREQWIGKKVLWKGKIYTVISVEHNGTILIDKLIDESTYTCVERGSVTLL